MIPFPHPCDGHAPSRRNLIGGGAALGLMTAGGANSAGATDDYPVYDTHHHFMPPAYLASPLMKGHRFVPDDSLRNWTPEDSIAMMDRMGIAKAIVSITTPGIWRGAPEDALGLARICNDFGAEMARKYPKRFGFWATIPLPYIDGSLREAARAMDELGAAGIGLVTNYGDRFLGHADFRPVFEALNRRGPTTIYVHPDHAACCANIQPEIPGSFMEFPFNTTRSNASLLYNGVYADCPNLRFIWSHGGGTMPMLAKRLSLWRGADPERMQRIAPQGIEHELRKQYYDTVTMTRGAGLAALLAFAPTDHIVFGTDIPFVQAPQLADMRASGIAAPDLKRILSTNARGITRRA